MQGGLGGGHGSVDPWAHVAHAWCHSPEPERARMLEIELLSNGVPDSRRGLGFVVALLSCGVVGALIAVLV